MIAMELPEDAHVVRYASPRQVHADGSLDSSVFRLRPQDAGLSINWLEAFGDTARAQQLEQVRRLSRLNMRPNGRLAELNVGRTKRLLRERLPTLSFRHQPLAADDRYAADPSHSEIAGLPPGDSLQAALIGDMIAEVVLNLHPAVNGS